MSEADVELIREGMGAFARTRRVPHELIDAGPGRVVSSMRFEGLHGGSGIDAGMCFAALWELDAGRVTRVRAFGTADEALRAAGPG